MQTYFWRHNGKTAPAISAIESAIDARKKMEMAATKFTSMFHEY
jgi:hypothetical protein